MTGHGRFERPVTGNHGPPTPPLHSAATSPGLSRNRAQSGAQLSRPRTPRRQFLSPTGTRTTPMRQLPIVADEVDTVDRIREAASIRDEPEMVSGAWLEDWADVALLHQSQQHALDVANMQTIRPGLPPEKRLEDIQRRAKHSHVNLSREVMIMGAEIRRARTGNRTIPGRVLRRMETVEALLDGLA